MHKVFTVLALIAFARNISRDVLVHGNSVRQLEAAGRNGGYEYQTKSRVQFDDAEVPQAPAENPERSSESPVGKWRSNGEALEPKWRDGDSVPLLPFSHYRSYTRDEVEDVEHDLPEASRRPLKYHYALDHPRGRRLPPLDDYPYRIRDYETLDEDYPRKRRRPLKSLPNPTLYEETIDSAVRSDGKRGRNVDGSLNDREVTWRYREAFQARPNEYEHEFDDEEYLRPRPRKRRPPQNYEFALANEASSDNGDEEWRSSSRHSSKDDKTIPIEPSNKEREHALELKSLLKMQQEEGLSLSEILQRKNLTLSDLLKGKADVINALKSKITEESDEYIEEMSRVMSDSLMKLAATVTPWKSTTQSATIEGTMTRIVSDTIPDSSVSQMTAAMDETKDFEISANGTTYVKGETNDTEETTQSAHESSWLRAPTTPLTLSTITTSTSPPSAVNSAEYFLNDDGNAESTSDRVARLESLDEDEIMEFSDFTDIKKGKNLAAPVWSNLPERVISQQTSRDSGSTLSIEQILNPTERTKQVEGRENNDDDTSSNDERTVRGGQSISIGVPSAKGYNTFNEYHNVSKTPESNEKQSKIKDKTDDIVDQIKEIANSTDDRRELDKNHAIEYHQVTRLPEERTRDRALENHRDTRRYEEVISEIEPEARAEIFELFASGSAGKRLERLLKSRNMSVEELIALRQRGSSKVHLTEVSQLKMSKLKNHQANHQETSRTNGEIIVPVSFENYSDKLSGEDKISEKQDTRQQVEETMYQFKDIMSYLRNPFFDKDVENMSMSRLLDLVEQDRNAAREAIYPDNNTTNTVQNDTVINGHINEPNSHRTIVDLLTTFDSLPFAKDIQQFETEVNEKYEPQVKLSIDNNTSVVITDEEKIPRSDNPNDLHSGYIEEIVKDEPDIIDIKTAVYGETMNNMTNAEEKKTLSKMKPSIIASGAILGVTIVVFLAIFIACRIRQKQKYTYRHTFSRAVFQGPIMAARKLSNSSSLSAVMVNVVATSTTKRPEKTETQEEDFDGKSDMDNDSLDANDSWETIPDYAK